MLGFLRLSLVGDRALAVVLHAGTRLRWRCFLARESRWDFFVPSTTKGEVEPFTPPPSIGAGFGSS